MPSEKQIEKMYENLQPGTKEWAEYARQRESAAMDYARNLNLDKVRELEQANAKQIAGQHYKKQKIQAWDFVAQNDLDYFQGSIIKYVTRWKDKGGIDDLKKAIHFLEKYIEVESGKSIGGT